jgi:hypothetical protein
VGGGVVTQFAEREVKSAHPLGVLALPFKQLEEFFAELLYGPSIFQWGHLEELVEERFAIVIADLRYPPTRLPHELKNVHPLEVRSSVSIRKHDLATTSFFHSGAPAH